MPPGDPLKWMSPQLFRITDYLVTYFIPLKFMYLLCLQQILMMRGPRIFTISDLFGPILIKDCLPTSFIKSQYLLNVRVCAT